MRSDKKTIGSNWVYKVKLKPNGTVDRYKAKLVAKGYDQVECVHYIDRFSPVAKAVTVRTLLVDATIFGLEAVESRIDAPSDAHILAVKQFLDSVFTINDLGQAQYFLRLEIARSVAGISVSQHKYIRDIIQDMGLSSSKIAATPLPLGIKLTVVTDSPLLDPEPYCRLKTKKQTTVARSNAEAEYCSLGTTATIHIVANPGFHECTKHLEIDCHLVRDKFREGFVLPSNISRRLQLANMFTKSFSGAAFAATFSKLRMPFHTTPDLFLSPCTPQNLIREVAQEREAFSRERETQFRLYFHPLERDLQAFLRSGQLQNGPVTMPASANTAGPSRPSLLNLSPSMKIVSWNCRGAGRLEFITAARDLIHRTNPEIFIVMDTCMHEQQNMVHVEPCNYYGQTDE
ncbi:UNVERIFIED_CONTAM: Retrovirus-related Pol polyprotein from transposon RE1 [Sesamum calycinum]|uniref:Retrovirus-related Pol polyprotein from transposon RE1 n=1 Tax=Sesamum calycinum TaxID=2727403 RepID=A0AAW2QKR7_9LAMI